MKELKQYISEWKLTSDNNSSVGHKYNYKPANKKELIDILQVKLEENEKKPYLLDIDTSMITDMEELFGPFYYCSQKIEILDLRSWNVSRVKTMNAMFEGLTYLKSVNTIGWNTSNVKDMYCMFNNCHELEEIIGIESWNTKSVTDVIDMFAYCRKLKSLDFKKWDVSNIENMSEMFWQCSGLKKIDNIENWVINSRKLNGVFLGCESLEYLDISNWTFKVQLSDIGRLFYGCKNLKEVKGINVLPDVGFREDIFKDCDNLSYYPRWY